MNIPLFKVHTPEKMGFKLQEIFDSWFLTEGEYSDRFEKEFGALIGNPNTCLTNSCTSALDLARYMCGVGKGDEVITTAMTCMATNLPFYNSGARLVFADVEKDTGNINPESIISKITEKTKAIIVVHWAGQPVNLEAISKISEQHGIPVIEDAAHALNSSYDGKKIGLHSDYVCFSFQAIKHLTTGDGGAILCNTKENAAILRKARWFGLDRTIKSNQRWSQDITDCGYKYHMNNINAFIGLEQLKYINDLTDLHTRNGLRYDKEINNPKLQKMRRNPNSTSACWIYSLLAEDRVSFQKYLAENGIASDWVHVRNDQYSIFKDFKTDLPNLDYFESRLINIPVGWWLSEEEINKIISTVNNYNY